MKIAERFARIFITIGGVGTILAVTTICIFLVWVVIPLFKPGRIEPAHVIALEGALAESRPATPLKLAIDEFNVLCWTLDADGELLVRRLDDGAILMRTDLFAETATASAFGIGDGRVAFGFSDGATRIGSVQFSSDLLPPEQAPELRSASPGMIATRGDAVLVKLADGQIRKQSVLARIDAPVASEAGSAVKLLDQSITPAREMLCVLRADGSLVVEEITRTRNLLTDEEKVEVAAAHVPYQKRENGDAPRFLRITERGDGIYLAWADGYLQRYDCRDLAKPELAEVLDLVKDDGRSLTCLEFLNGRTTLIAGDSAGGVGGWFPTKPPDAPNPDGIVMRRVHGFEAAGAAITACATSTRTRMFTTGDAQGRVRVLQMTTASEIANVQALDDGAVDLVQIAPKSDAVVALGRATLATMTLRPGHAEVTPRSILLPVWYEGSSERKHVWQSAGASDDFEPKLGLMPLVFGTLKATFYSLLFAVPIALLAAIYTSEFLHPRIRARVKPAIEMMASLPSVVLGFLAAIVLAPFVERVVPAVLLSFLVIPVMFLVGALFWQLLPQAVTARLSGWPRLLAIAALLPLGLLLAGALGPVCERWFFAGDMKAWLDGQVGRSTGGFALLLMLPAALGVLLLFSRVVTPRLLAVSQEWGRERSALVSLCKFIVGAMLTVGIAWSLGALLDVAGFDVRRSFLGTYNQRNALIVGFVMGFTVIPIIYTLAEDALASVPAHLRSGSLGCGATQWQTAIRIILPTAFSGIFSAIMVGLGRAVGETMVVLMAAGNTPVMEWSMFSGFRTLAANIAYELPEASQGSTHYRMLFLAALSLFVITFILNTAAEAVRARFRRRAYQL